MRKSSDCIGALSFSVYALSPIASAGCVMRLPRIQVLHTSTLIIAREGGAGDICHGQVRLRHKEH